MTERLTRRGALRTRPLNDAIPVSSSPEEPTTISDDESEGAVALHSAALGLKGKRPCSDPPKKERMLRCGSGSRSLICHCMTRSLSRKRPRSSWCPSPASYGLFSLNYCLRIFTQSVSSSAKIRTSLAEEVTETDDETPESRSAETVQASLTHSVLLGEQMLSLSASDLVANSDHLLEMVEEKKLQELEPQTDLQDIASPRSISSRKFDSFSSDCNKTSKTRKLPDYSKVMAVLPEVSPIDYTIPANYARNDRDGEESSHDERDFFPSISSTLDQKVYFFMKLPKSKLKNRPRTELPDTLSRSHHSHSRNASTSPKKEKPRINGHSISSSRRRSNSSESREVATAQELKAPIAAPNNLSRQSSEEKIPEVAKTYQSFVSPLPIKPSLQMQMQMPVGQGLSPSTVDSVEEFGEEIVALNDEPDYRPRLGDSDDECLGCPDRQAYSDDDMERENKAVKRKSRMKRRSSFVAGSKIERFEPIENSQGKSPIQRRRRGRNQRRSANNKSDSYTEWKIDLMVNGYTSNVSTSHDYDRP